MRTWHIQLAIFWVATSFLAAGIFLAPMIAGREPKHQAWLAYGLLGALALVVFGSMAGEYIGIHGGLKDWWAWFGNQGFEYLDLGRFWQILLTIGLFFWVILLFRGLRGRLAGDHKGNMPWLFRRFTRWGCWRGPPLILLPQNSGASGSCICGLKIFSNSSRRSWSLTSLYC